MLKEWTYHVAIPAPWAGHYGGGSRGGGEPGKVIGGVIEANTEVEARSMISARHPDAKILYDGTPKVCLHSRMIPIRQGI